MSNNIVYAEDPRVLCWLWNQKDGEEASIDESSEYLLFFVDAFEKERAVIALQVPYADWIHAT